MGGEVQPRPGPTASHSTPSLTAPVRQCPNVPANSRQSGPRAPLTVSYPAISLTTATVGRHRHPPKRLQIAADPASTRIRAPTIHVCYFLSPLPVSSPRPSLSIGGFGLRLRWYQMDWCRRSCRGSPRRRTLGVDVSSHADGLCGFPTRVAIRRMDDRSEGAFGDAAAPPSSLSCCSETSASDTARCDDPQPSYVRIVELPQALGASSS